MGVISEILSGLCETLSHTGVSYYPETADVALGNRGELFGIVGVVSAEFGEESGGWRNAELTVYVSLLGADNAGAQTLIPEFEGILERLAQSGNEVSSVRCSGCAYSRKLARHELRCELKMRGVFGTAPQEVTA